MTSAEVMFLLHVCAMHYVWLQLRARSRFEESR